MHTVYTYVYIDSNICGDRTWNHMGMNVECAFATIASAWSYKQVARRLFCDSLVLQIGYSSVILPQLGPIDRSFVGYLPSAQSYRCSSVILIQIGQLDWLFVGCLATAWSFRQVVHRLSCHSLILYRQIACRLSSHSLVIQIGRSSVILPRFGPIDRSLVGYLATAWSYRQVARRLSCHSLVLLICCSSVILPQLGPIDMLLVGYLATAWSY